MEGGNTPIIVIDVQPAYDKWCGKIMPALTNFLNKSHGPVLCFFNDPEVGGNVEHEVVDYYLENGIEDDRLNSIDFRPKTYAFFRGWMDAGMERKFIIKAIRYMVMNDIRDSREITTKEWEKIFTDVGAKDFELDDLLRIVEDEPLFVPDISISELKRFSGCYLCGGAKDQCLSEFRFLLEAFNIRYKLVNSLIY
jgi:hypothetical protein